MIPPPKTSLHDRQGVHHSSALVTPPVGSKPRFHSAAPRLSTRRVMLEGNDFRADLVRAGLGIRALAIAPSLSATGLTAGIGNEFATVMTKNAASAKRLGKARGERQARSRLFACPGPAVASTVAKAPNSGVCSAPLSKRHAATGGAATVLAYSATVACSTEDIPLPVSPVTRTTGPILVMTCQTSGRHTAQSRLSLDSVSPAASVHPPKARERRSLRLSGDSHSMSYATLGRHAR